MTGRGLLALLLLTLAACGPEPSKAPADKGAPAPAPASSPDQGAVDDHPDPPPSVPAAADEPPPPIDAAAIEQRYTPRYAQCLDTGSAAQGVTTAMVDCIVAELRLQDGALNAEYQRVMSVLPAPQAVLLRARQRRWINERDGKCRAAASSGGSIDRLNGPACVLQETVRRTIELERIAPPPTAPDALESPAPQRP